MDNFLKFIITLWIIFFIYLLFLFFDYIRYKDFLKSLKNKPCNCKILEKIEIYNHLPQNLKNILNEKIKRFIYEKKFIPKYLKLTEEIKILIAFYACLPTIAFKNFCYHSLKYIFIYPHTIIKDHINQNGIIKKEVLISGEAVGDSVIIAWNEAKRDIFKYRKRNVILHEFAHELDYEDGVIDGIPVFAHIDYDNFVKIFKKTYNKAIKDRILDEYAYTNYAEFFAVTTEYFFLKPKTLKVHYPELFDEYKKIYKFNPILLKTLDFKK